MTLLNPELASAIDFEHVEFFSDRGFECMPHQDNRFRVDLAARLKIVENSGQDEDDEDEDDEDDEGSLYGVSRRYLAVHLVVVDEPTEELIG